MEERYEYEDRTAHDTVDVHNTIMSVYTDHISRALREFEFHPAGTREEIFAIATLMAQRAIAIAIAAGCSADEGAKLDEAWDAFRAMRKARETE